MPRTLPPFRADHVGSLLRPAAVREARAQRELGQISAETLAAVEDAAIRDVIGKQQAVGLHGITDGEFRREFWHIDFLASLGGVESYVADHGIQFKGGQTRPKAMRVTGKIHFAGHPMVDL